MSDVKIKTAVDHNAHYRKKKQILGMVDIEDEESLNKWAQNLHISTEELVRAVKLYGPMVNDIRRGLNKQQAA